MTAEPSASTISGHSRLNITVPGSSCGSVFARRASASRVAIPGVVAARRPARGPPAWRGTTRPRPRRRACSSPRPRRPRPTPRRERWRSRRTAARRRAGGPGTSRVGQGGQHASEALYAVHDQVGALDDLRRPLVRAHADQHGRVERALVLQLPERVEGVEVGGVVAARTCAARADARSTRDRTARPLSNSTGGRTSSTLRAQWTARPACSASPATSSRLLAGGVLVRHAAPVVGPRSAPCPRSAPAACAAPGCPARRRSASRRPPSA